jgi:thiamine kinase-like enzyme
VAESAAASAADEVDVRASLRACTATSPLAGGHLTRLHGGLSNRAWRLDSNGERWFVRLGHPQAARLGVDRRSECVVLQAVSAAGLAPAVRACEPATGLLVARFIDGRAWSAAEAQSLDNIRRVARCLRRLHELPMPAGVRDVDYGRQARRLAATLPQADTNRAVLAERAVSVLARLGDHEPQTTLCHNDLHHLNLIDDGAQVWLVDWEYGGRGNPLFDLAGFLVLQDLGPGPTEVFLEAYGRLPASARRHLDDARWLFDYVQWLWYRSRFPGPVGDEARHAERLAQRLLRCNN